MLLVAITDNGIKVNTNIVFVFSGEIKKTTIPIKKAKIIFLNEAWRIKGLFVTEKIIENTKYKAVTTYTESAIF